MKKDGKIAPDTLLEELFLLRPEQAAALKRLRISTVRDLLYYFPARYEKPSHQTAINSLSKGTQVTVFGRVVSTKISRGFRTRIPMGEAVIEDSTGKIRAVWFHQPYLVKTLAVGSAVKITGKVAERRGAPYIANPRMEALVDIPTDGMPLFRGEDSSTVHAVYPETEGLSSLWFQHHIETLIKKNVATRVADPIPEAILQRYKLPSLSSALVFIHTPKKESDARAARKRFSFEEIFLIQLARLRDRALYQSRAAFPVTTEKKHLAEFIALFPFSLTKAQRTVVGEIVSDLAREVPMTRLIEGDVGSGKTAVAAIAAHAVVHATPPENRFARLQVAYMAPTEILARQHFESFLKYFHGSGVGIGLLTGSGCVKFPSKINPAGTTAISRSQFIKFLQSGEISIVIGTHALIEKSVELRHLALAIIDEQHRFGTMQRARLLQKGARVPHLLSMTATPIPRTLALTIYGDLDLSVIDELPAGRAPVHTRIVTSIDRPSVYSEVRECLKSGRQAFVICPRIDLPDPKKALALNAKSAKEEAGRLAHDVFPGYSVGLLHGKMRPAEKETAMKLFVGGKTDILVATSVVEVGVNVPNAVVMIIEGAERFGLAQLHQLRGRIARSTYTAHCYLVTETRAPESIARLRAIVEAKNGFELAEKDLTLRGAGQLSGAHQWGISDIGMEAIRNLRLVEAARTEAKSLIQKDPTFENSPTLALRVAMIEKTTHFE
ncbi:MAG: ATP-dependent DNA helicase RecG [Minisyncoccota bacterium]